jgi:hypothetical protein
MMPCEMLASVADSSRLWASSASRGPLPGQPFDLFRQGVQVAGAARQLGAHHKIGKAGAHGQRRHGLLACAHHHHGHGPPQPAQGLQGVAIGLLQRHHGHTGSMPGMQGLALGQVGGLQYLPAGPGALQNCLTWSAWAASPSISRTVNSIQL